MDVYIRIYPVYIHTYETFESEVYEVYPRNFWPFFKTPKLLITNPPP